MFDFDAAMQIALSPFVTLPVIGVLIVLLIGTIVAGNYRLKQKLRAQAKRLGRTTGELLAMSVQQGRRDADRRVNKAIEFTYDTLKGIGWDRLAEGNLTFEDFVTGSPLTPNKQRDPFLHPSLDELHDALRPKSSEMGGRPYRGGPKDDPRINRKVAPGAGHSGTFTAEVDYGFGGAHGPRAG